MEWLVKKGDTVKKGDSIAVVETEKLAFEVEAPETGVIEKLRYSGGDKVNLTNSQDKPSRRGLRQILRRIISKD